MRKIYHWYLAFLPALVQGMHGVIPHIVWGVRMYICFFQMTFYPRFFIVPRDELLLMPAFLPWYRWYYDNAEDDVLYVMMLLLLMVNKCNDEYRLNVLAWIDGSEVLSFHLDIIHLGILAMLVLQVLPKNWFPLLRLHICHISFHHCFIPFFEPFTYWLVLDLGLVLSPCDLLLVLFVGIYVLRLIIS